MMTNDRLQNLLLGAASADGVSASALAEVERHFRRAEDDEQLAHLLALVHRIDEFFASKGLASAVDQVRSLAEVGFERLVQLRGTRRRADERKRNTWRMKMEFEPKFVVPSAWNDPSGVSVQDLWHRRSAELDRPVVIGRQESLPGPRKAVSSSARRTQRVDEGPAPARRIGVARPLKDPA